MVYFLYPTNTTMQYQLSNEDYLNVLNVMKRSAFNEQSILLPRPWLQMTTSEQAIALWYIKREFSKNSYILSQWSTQNYLYQNTLYHVLVQIQSLKKETLSKVEVEGVFNLFYNDESEQI